MGTNQPTNQPTDRRTDAVSYRGATSHLKTCLNLNLTCTIPTLMCQLGLNQLQNIYQLEKILWLSINNVSICQNPVFKNRLLSWGWKKNEVYCYSWKHKIFRSLWQLFTDLCTIENWKNLIAWEDRETTQKMSSIWASYLKLFRNGGQWTFRYQKLHIKSH
jgi:hypothetical protein